MKTWLFIIYISCERGNEPKLGLGSSSPTQPNLLKSSGLHFALLTLVLCCLRVLGVEPRALYTLGNLSTCSPQPLKGASDHLPANKETLVSDGCRRCHFCLGVVSWDTVTTIRGLSVGIFFLESPSFLLRVWVFCLHACVHHVYTVPRRWHPIPCTGVAGAGQTPCERWETRASTECSLSTTEPPLQTLEVSF